MNAYKTILLILLFLPIVSAQYWFQSGARGGQSTQFNSGASVTIQTITTQNPVSGSIAYWIGEDLQNGAFIQVGYVIENQSGRYPSYCDSNGCSKSEYLSAGAPEWFYEYFPPGDDENFYGGIGPNDSAGKNGTFNTYGFYANGSIWRFVMNGNNLGAVNLLSNTSGYNDVVAFGELANTSNGNTTLPVVSFYNLSIYRFGRFVPSPTGFSYIGYGVGSLSNIPNRYGVQEIGARANAFEVGSGLTEPHNSYPLWTSSYSLTILSQYGNVSSSGAYIASRTVALSAPVSINVTNNTRAVFVGWQGNGPGSYSGQSGSAAVLMYSNITETAQWQLQYYVNVTSSQLQSKGTGWYPANSTAYYLVAQNTVYQNASSRYLFGGWKNGSQMLNGTAKVTGPLDISAIWNKQYFVNTTAQYGNATGAGWYAANSTASVAILSPYKNLTKTSRLAFFSWSDGNMTSPHTVVVNMPYNLYASYKNQYLVNFMGVDEYGSSVNAQTFYLQNSSVGSHAYLFGGQTYQVTGALYKGTNVSFTQQISTNSSANISIHIPLYNIQVYATDVFGNPVQVPVVLTLPNGTTRSFTTGKNGTSAYTVVTNVPYGKALAQAQYYGLQLSSSVQNGEQVKFTVVSVRDISIFGGVILLAFIMYYLASRHVLQTPAKK